MYIACLCRNSWCSFLDSCYGKLPCLTPTPLAFTVAREGGVRVSVFAPTMSFQLHPILDLGQPLQRGVWYAVSPEMESAGALEDKSDTTRRAAAVARDVLSSTCAADLPPHAATATTSVRVACPGPRVGACASFLASGEGGKLLLTAGATPEGTLSDVHELNISPCKLF